MPGNGEIRWKPSVPIIGDLVSVESSAGVSLQGPDGSVILPLHAEFTDGGKKLFWSFRITQSGDWSALTADVADAAGAAPAVQKLWTAASIAGKETELKTMDAQGLWSGKKVKK